jgi:hypothetical protein
MRSVLLCLLSLALAPAGVDAAVIEAPADCDRYGDRSYQAIVRAEPGEANQLTVSAISGRVVFSDPGVVMRAGEGCTNDDDHVVRCLSDVTSVRVLAADGDDAVDASAFNRGPVTIDGGPGDDVLIGGAGGDHLMGGTGRDEVHGGPGPDWISFADAQSSVRVDLRSQTARVAGHVEHFDGIENVQTGSGDDVLFGDRADNELVSGPGADTLSGGRGDDVLTSGRGTDVVRGGPGDDYVSGLDSRRRDNADRVGCGTGHDKVDQVDAPNVIRDDCEQLFASDFTFAFALWHQARVLRVPRWLLGSHMRLTVTVLLDGRVQRVFHRRVASRQLYPRGVWRLSLNTPAIALARASGAARVTLKILAIRPLGEEYRATLHLLLGRTG